MLFSLNHDLGPSAGNVRIRVDRCPTTYFSGRCSYLDGRGDTGEEAGAGCCKATARAPAISSAVAKLPKEWLAQLRACRVSPDHHVG
jgi:hypothetical protein